MLIGIITAIAIPTINNAKAKGRDTRISANLRELNNCVSRAKLDGLSGDGTSGNDGNAAIIWYKANGLLAKEKVIDQDGIYYANGAWKKSSFYPQTMEYAIANNTTFTDAQKAELLERINSLSASQIATLSAKNALPVPDDLGNTTPDIWMAMLTAGTATEAQIQQMATRVAEGGSALATALQKSSLSPNAQALLAANLSKLAQGTLTSPTFSQTDAFASLIALATDPTYQQGAYSGYNFSGMNLTALTPTTVSKLYLKGANLQGTTLSGLNLTNKDLSNANFTGALVQNTNFTGATYNQTQFDAYTRTGNTIYSNGYTITQPTSGTAEPVSNLGKGTPAAATAVYTPTSGQMLISQAGTWTKWSNDFQIGYYTKDAQGNKTLTQLFGSNSSLTSGIVSPNTSVTTSIPSGNTGFYIKTANGYAYSGDPSSAGNQFKVVSDGSGGFTLAIEDWGNSRSDWDYQDMVVSFKPKP
jgi:uncharacterized protein YjbI with pentapeptide repeats